MWSIIVKKYLIPESYCFEIDLTRCVYVIFLMESSMGVHIVFASFSFPTLYNFEDQQDLENQLRWFVRMKMKQVGMKQACRDEIIISCFISTN